MHICKKIDLSFLKKKTITLHRPSKRYNAGTIQVNIHGVYLLDAMAGMIGLLSDKVLYFLPLSGFITKEHDVQLCNNYKLLRLV